MQKISSQQEEISLLKVVKAEREAPKEDVQRKEDEMEYLKLQLEEEKEKNRELEGLVKKLNKEILKQDVNEMCKTIPRRVNQNASALAQSVKVQKRSTAIAVKDLK